MPTASGTLPNRLNPGEIVVDFKISTNNRSGRSIDLGRTNSLASAVLGKLALAPRCSVSVTYVTLEEMERLHIEHMAEPGATDVLSFPFDELHIPLPGEVVGPGMLGDIVICPDFAEVEAAKRNESLVSELDLLLVHGLLHLLGLDHAEPEEHQNMFRLQAELLTYWQESQ